jgi:hypothetical protein
MVLVLSDDFLTKGLAAYMPNGPTGVNHEKATPVDTRT